MNTLSKETTLGRFFNEDPENYTKLRAQWSKMVNSELKDTLTFADHVFYLIFIGKNWQKAVTLPTNKNKLENHYKPKIKELEEQVEGTFSKLRLENNIIEKFDGTVTRSMIQNAIKLATFSMTEDPYTDLTDVAE